MGVLTDMIKQRLRLFAGTSMTEMEFIEREIQKWKNSQGRKEQVLGEKYYQGEHDILERQRTAIGEDGKPTVVHHLPNNRIVDNQYSLAVDKKVNYEVGKPLTFKTDNKAYEEALKEALDDKFHRTLKNAACDALNGAVGWIHPYYDEDGVFRFSRFAPYEALPLWADTEHTKLEMLIRLYEVEDYEGQSCLTREFVEIYKPDGVEYYELKNGRIKPDTMHENRGYIDVSGKPHAWEGRIPVVPFKYNSKEIPLIRRVKSLQDAINALISDFMNNMQEDARNTVIVLKNYEGEDLGEFRRNFALYGVIKVNTSDGVNGGVETLTVEVNAENYNSILNTLKKALIENARSFDAKDDRLSGQPNQMNIQSMYSDIDLDASGMEVEFKASMKDLLWFVNMHLANTGKGDFDGEEVTVIFNKDILINETEAIGNIRSSVGILSKRTLIEQHPYTDNVEKEMAQVDEEEQRAMEQYQGAFDGNEEGGANEQADQS